MEIKLTPIGIVKNNVTESKREEWQKVISEIIINDNLTEALSGIEEFSHLIILYWMHKLAPSEYTVTRVHPKGDQNLPLVGVFASRSPARPNPIGVTTVKLLEVRNNVLKVVGLDAIDGTPVIDIKPFIHQHDQPSDCKIPGWLHPDHW